MLPEHLDLVAVLQDDDRSLVLRVRDLRAGGVERVYKRVAADNARAMASLVAEFELVRRLKHPNLAQVAEFGRDGEFAWLLREFVPGKTLTEGVGSLDEDELRRVLIDSLRALAHLHSRGLLHLDVKPDNIILHVDGTRSVLTDLGLGARIDDGATRRGTPPFVAPEVALGARADARSDLFSLGAAILLSHRDAPVVDPGTLYLRFPRLPFVESVGVSCTELFPSLGGWLERMLATDPIDRPRSAAALLADLGAEEGDPEDLAAMLRPEGDLADAAIRGSIEAGVIGEAGGVAWILLASDLATARECVDRLRFVAASNDVSIRFQPASPPSLQNQRDSPLDARLSPSERAITIAKATIAPSCEPIASANDTRKRPSMLLLADTCAEDAFPRDVALSVAWLLRDGRDGARPGEPRTSEPGACARIVVVALEADVSTEELDAFDQVLAVRGPDAERLAAQLASFEGSDPDASRERLFDVASALAEAHQRNPEKIAQHLARWVDSGEAEFIGGRLDLSCITGATVRSDPGESDQPLSSNDARVAFVVAALGKIATLDRCIAVLGADAPSALIATGAARRFRRDSAGRVSCDTPRPIATLAQHLAPEDVADLAHRVLEEGGDDLPHFRRAHLHLLAGDETTSLATLVEAPRGPIDDDPISELLNLDASAPAPHLRARIAFLLAPKLASMGRMDEARSHYEAALETRSLDAEERGDAALGLAEVCLLGGDAERAEALLLRSRRMPARDAAARAFAVARGRAFVRLRRGDSEGAVVTLEAVLRSWKGAREIHAAWLRVLLGTFRARMGDHGKALATLDEAVHDLRALEPSPLRDHLIPTGLANLATLHLRGGRLAFALDAIDESRALRAESGRVLEEANLQNNRSIVLREMGRLGDAHAAASEASRLFRFGGDPLGEASARANLAEVLALRGELDAARGTLEHAIGVVSRLEAGRELGLCRTRLALLHVECGRFEEALAELAKLPPSEDARATAWREIASSSCAAAGSLEPSAIGAAKRAISAAHASGDAPLEARAHLAHARLLISHQTTNLAGPALENALRLATPLLHPDVTLAMGHLSVAQGAAEEALALFLAARDEARSQDRPLLRARAAAAAAAVPYDNPRHALPLALEAIAALAAVEETGSGTGSREERLIGKELAMTLRMSDPSTSRSKSDAPLDRDAVPVEMFRAIAANCRRLARATDLDHLLDSVVDHAITLTGARRGFLLLVRGTEIARKISRVEDPEDDRVSRSIVLDAVRQRRPIVTANANADGRFSGRQSIEELDLRSVLCAPFRLDSGMAGALYVDNPVREGLFSPRSIDFLEVLADQAALAISNLEHRTEIEALRKHRPDRRPREPGAPKEAATPEPLTLVGSSEAFTQMTRLLAKVAPSDIPLLVLGESGSGKELVARAIHVKSRRAARPFVAVNVSAIPEALMEAELFGYRKGAFTGAIRDHDGLFVQAHEGTLFLDEIGDMPPTMQSKLLRALQEQIVRPVGSVDAEEVDIRLICATHHDLAAAVSEQRFREDLYYRIRGAVLTVPPLRDRPGDVKHLVEHFLARWNREHGMERQLAPELLSECERHAWPGNVRELESEIRRLVHLAEGTEVIGPLLRDDVGSVQKGGALVHLRPMAEIEREAYQMALEQTDGNRERAAELLGVARATFYARLKRMEQEGDDPTEA